ncbi:PaaI family thioesterase [Mitsuaria sp. WAJ17]|uniref:PaaI family thioesterase n=1 Tax=Mitsuaria sp. WAJ17 TaxID=2761452 RepID=UPI001600620E|nr:PaaI family thioesterase [Mitsuaria sp. WAJ17]MBB2486002.1 PaaI family thioesterase [Mitsuaria sp. WAJ17]
MELDLATLQGFIARSPFMVELGVQAVAVEPGRVRTRLAIREGLCQHTGLVHAGVLASLADHSMGSAAQTLAPAGQWVLTAELKTSLLRGARGLELDCEAWVIKAGRTLSFTEAEVHAVDGETRTLVMKASATMALTAA